MLKKHRMYARGRGRGEGVFIYKVYMCGCGLNMGGGLGSGPSLQMVVGLSERPLTEKIGDLELKISKKRIFLERGSFVASQAENVGSLRAAQAERCGLSAAHTRTALIWEYPPPPARCA